MGAYSFFRAVVIAAGLSVGSSQCLLAGPAEDIAFDLPSSIECRDVTTNEFAAANPQLKQIEAKVRISARESEGTTAEIVQVDYEIRLARPLRVVDYLPKTFLESAVVADQIDITAAKEDSRANGTDAAIAYKPLIIGGSHNTTAKKSEAKHFKQVAQRDVVLASGTVERERGVFFRVRPSRSATFEGSREFVLVAAVPRGWRADVCEVSCTARVSKHSMIGTSVSSIGGQRTSIGMYLVGDVEAATTAEDFRKAQDAYQQIVAGQGKSKFAQAISTSAGSVFAREALKRKQSSVDEAARSFEAVQEHIKRLSASSSRGA
jgi:hypothetical protein